MTSGSIKNNGSLKILDSSRRRTPIAIDGRQPNLEGHMMTARTTEVNVVTRKPS